MKKIIGGNDGVEMSGKVKVQAFQAGFIPYLMAERGLTLREAMAEACRLGGMVYEHSIHNLVTTVGKQFLARHLSGEEIIGLRYLAVGTGTTEPAISDIKLQSESLRKLMAECYQGDTFTYSSIFMLASECSFHITEGGLFGGASANAAANSGSLYCRFLLDDDNSAGANDLTVQHTAEVK